MRKTKPHPNASGRAVKAGPNCRCGECGGSNFAYSNGQEWSADGIRGYRCAGCGNVKPEPTAFPGLNCPKDITDAERLRLFG